MGNINTKKVFEFLESDDGIEYFTELDFQLKNGIHIQNIHEQQTFFDILENNNNFESLKAFYDAYCGLPLKMKGQDSQKYFFLDFNEKSRGKFKSNHYESLDAEHIIIAFLLYRIVIIDINIGLDSVKDLKRVILKEYDSVKPQLKRLLVRTEREQENPEDNDMISSAIDRGLRKFRDLSWIRLEGDTFEPLPSFERIYEIYKEPINDLPKWIEQQIQ